MLNFFATSKKVAEMDKTLAESFAKVKHDTETLYQWVNYLYHQNQTLVEQNTALRRLSEEQKFALNEVKVTVAHLPKTPHEIKALIDQFYSFEPIMQRIKHIEQKIDLIELKRHPSPVQARPLEYEAPSVSTEPVERRTTALKEKLIRKLARNSKDYIKNLILSLVHKYEKMAAVQMREMLVEEQGLCSRSSFYRILEEMQKEGSLHVVSSGKHTVYVASSTHPTR